MKQNSRFLKELLQGAEVEWLKLGDERVCRIEKGKQLNRMDLKEEGLYPAYNGGKNHSGWTDKYNVEANTIIISQGGASAGYVNFITVPFWANAHCYYLIPNLESVNVRFLYHLLKRNEGEFMSVQHGAGIPALAKSRLEEFLIPLPPLAVQEEIVKILDNFTELTAELTARQKQYEYYRDLILSFGGVCEFQSKKLGELVNLKRGKRLVRSELETAGEYAVYQNSLQPLGYYHEANCPSNATFIIAAGAAGEIGYSMVEFWAADDCYYLECPRELLNDRYLYYALINQKQKITEQVRKASVPRLGRVSIENIQIPLPPLEEQERIVDILDRFDTLANSISEGLPREIELRRKQYEYYRDLLLNFKRVENVDDLAR